MIKIGDTIILESDYTGKIEKYKCKLTEKIGNDLYVDYPISLVTNRTVYLLEGTSLHGTFAASDGTHYFFETEVKGRKKEPFPTLVLSYPGKEFLIKIQRRQFVRIETAVDVAVHPRESEFAPFTAITDDISAGGAALLAGKNIKLHAGMQIDCLFVLHMQNGVCEYKKFKSKIVRIIEASETMNKISLQFIGTSDTDKQLLLRFCFERQLEYKKKGLPV
ncbi:flagellar brake protein [Bacillus sp. T33-2]|uniref:flagellar brake protein n=1 Tax=Bacillus sp. T33-2 TaxID=2054168 RepID=UPI000C7588F5|nr:flagellar brake domain-containing protein [Bacillus sp. T33-2]PLR99765.1 pilus assembly protein PilZ [Bacillus sp. T33-2]